MTKVLHTADLHLKQGAEDRIEVLKWLINKGQEQSVDLFIVAGDLFDSDKDAAALRPKVRSIMEKAPFKFLIIAGNHDMQSYDPNYNYGENVIQLTETPFELLKFGDLNIVGLPYQSKKFGECILNMPSDIDILIIHGTLYDTAFIFSVPSDLETPYMPIYPENLKNLARYVALGHIHSRTFSGTYQKTRVIYPGAPIALDTKCVGKRFVYYLEIDHGSLSVKPLEVNIAPYWEEKEFFVFPGIEENILSDVDAYLLAANVQKIMHNISIRGFIGESDKIFLDNVKQLQAKHNKKFLELRLNSEEIQSWDKIMDIPLAKKFIVATQGLTNELRKKILEITLPIFSDMHK